MYAETSTASFGALPQNAAGQGRFGHGRFRPPGFRAVNDDDADHRHRRHLATDRRVNGLWLRYCARSEEHTSELQSRGHLVCRLLLEKKKSDSTNVYKYVVSS